MPGAWRRKTHLCFFTGVVQPLYSYFRSRWFGAAATVWALIGPIS
jgi:hypothetical protein